MQTSTDIVTLPAAATASTSTALALAGDAVTEEEYHKRVKDVWAWWLRRDSYTPLLMVARYPGGRP